MFQENLDLDELETIGQVLLGAAFADGHADGDEVAVISDILAELIGADLPDALIEKLEAFQPSDFDLGAACGRLHLASADDRRALLTLVAEVVDADDLHTCTEDDYIIKVAHHIGASPEEYSDLTMEIFNISSIRPPPLPSDD